MSDPPTQQLPLLGVLEKCPHSCTKKHRRDVRVKFRNKMNLAFPTSYHFICKCLCFQKAGGGGAARSPRCCSQLPHVSSPRLCPGLFQWMPSCSAGQLTPTATLLPLSSALSPKGLLGLEGTGGSSEFFCQDGNQGPSSWGTEEPCTAHTWHSTDLRAGRKGKKQVAEDLPDPI